MTATATEFSDPVMFEVFKNALLGLCEEMGLVIARTAHSEVITVGLDFSTALADRDGRVLVQSNGIMSQVGAYPYALAAVRAKFADQVYPGDVYVFNDSDDVSMHLNDVFLIKPYFLGDDLIGYGLCTAHHADVGGKVPGSMDVSSSEIFQEGLQIPPVKLYERGRQNDDLIDIIHRNVRFEEVFDGDLQGQVAALHAGEVGLEALVERFTPASFHELSEELLDYSERLTATAIERIPDGTYEFEDFLDDDGLDAEHPPLPIRVKIVVEGDRVLVDWRGTAPQVKSAINVHMTHTRALSYGAVMGALEADIPNNDGFYRRITVQAPAGSIVNVQRPAARSMRAAVIFRMMDVLLGALHQAVPDRIPAGGCGGVALLQVSGSSEALGSFAEYLLIWSGWGGRPDRDGIDFVSPFSANLSAQSLEMVEQKGILQYEQLGFEPDTGGAGTWRGCLSMRLRVRVLHDDVLLRLQSNRHKSSAYGLEGGGCGTSSALVINPGTRDERVLPGTAAVTLGKNDRIDYRHSSGGGYGDPSERDPELVLEDVLDSKVTRPHAVQRYGVHVDESPPLVDVERTERLRTTLRDDRA